jgi:hypothetical protein
MGGSAAAAPRDGHDECDQRGGAVRVGGALLSHGAGVAVLAVLAAVNGSASAFFTPASRAALPSTVPETLLQPANAMLRLAQNGTMIIGTAAAGALVAAAGPGYAILVDGLTYFGGSAFLGAMRPRGTDVPGVPRTNVLAELREGWDAFRSRTWLWTIVVQFSFVNAVQSGSLNVLGPAIAKARLGGPAVWGAILTAQAIGYVVTGFLMLRLRVRRLLFFGTVCVFPMALPLIALARPLPARRDRRLRVPRRRSSRSLRRRLVHGAPARDATAPALSCVGLGRFRLDHLRPARARRRRAGVRTRSALAPLSWDRRRSSSSRRRSSCSCATFADSNIESRRSLTPISARPT